MLVKIKNVEMDLTDQAIKVSSQQVHPGERPRINQIKKKKQDFPNLSFGPIFFQEGRK